MSSYLRFSYDRTALTLGYDLTQLGWPASLNNQVVFRVAAACRMVTGYNGVFSTSGTGSTIIARNDSLLDGAQHDQDAGKPHDEVRRRDPPQHAQLLPAEQSVRAHSISIAHDVGQSVRRRPERAMVSRPSCLDMAPAAASHQNSLDGRPQISIAPTTWAISGGHSNRLTLNYGVRFEQMGPWSERYDRLSVLLPNAPDDPVLRKRV